MILFGASGHAKVIIDILEKSGKSVDFLVDANPGIAELLGYNVKHDMGLNLEKDQEVIVSIGDNAIRKKVAEEINSDFGWAIHPSVQLADDVKIGKGTVIMAGEETHIGAGATVIPNVTIGRWATIGAGAVIIKDVPDGATVVGNPGRIINIKHE